ncbi:MAG: HPF/RaiA family ribosome-associated protein [Gammaproteobacteria bacterium]|nr:HPF/RaiA family ribosome-associated protein [Gammaproteobacteria bacterium]
MQIPLQITFRDMPPSPAVEARIRQKVQKLESFYDRIMGCRVVVNMPQKHHHQGKLYNVRIDITVPGGEIAVNRQPDEDVYVALRDAFNAAGRQLEDYAREQRGDVKTHETPHHARVVKLFPEEDCGFIETLDGEQIYFHRNSVVHPPFDHLKIGTEVLFIEEQGEKGPQAKLVTVGKHHFAG